MNKNNKFIYILGFYFLLTSFPGFAQDTTGSVEWRVRTGNGEAFEAIKGVYPVRSDSGHTAYVNKTGLQNLEKKNRDFEIISGSRNKNRKKLPVKRSLQQTPFTSYPAYPAYENLMNGFTQQYPSICRLDTFKILPSGRQLLMLVITDNPDSMEHEPDFLYTSSMHGNEPGGFILMLNLIDTLLNSYGNSPRLTSLVNNIRISINPLANPDGLYHNGDTNDLIPIRFNDNAVDLNRNFPDPQAGMHPDGYSWQPETKAFMSLADSMGFDISANIHAGEEVVNYPWDTWDHTHANKDWWIMVSGEYADTAQAYSSQSYMQFSGGVTNGYDWYSIQGGRQDYMNYFRNTLEFTLELDKEKMTPDTSLNDLWNANKRSLLNYIEQARYGISGVVYDSLTNNPLRAKVFAKNFDKDSSHVYSRAEDGYYHRYFKAGSRQLTFDAPGYEPKEITVSNQGDSLTTLDVALVPEGYYTNRKQRHNIKIYPNPACDYVYIDFDNSRTSEEAILLDRTGKKVEQIKFESSGRYRLSVSELNSGVYFLKIKTGDEIYVRKLMLL